MTLPSTVSYVCLNQHKLFAQMSVTSCCCFYITHIKKGKAVPLQAWSGPEGSRKLRFPYFMTTAQEGGRVVSLNPPGYSFLLEADSKPGP